MHKTQENPLYQKVVIRKIAGGLLVLVLLNTLWLYFKGNDIWETFLGKFPIVIVLLVIIYACSKDMFNKPEYTPNDFRNAMYRGAVIGALTAVLYSMYRLYLIPGLEATLLGGVPVLIILILLLWDLSRDSSQRREYSFTEFFFRTKLGRYALLSAVVILTTLITYWVFTRLA